MGRFFGGLSLPSERRRSPQTQAQGRGGRFLMACAVSHRRETGKGTLKCVLEGPLLILHKEISKSIMILFPFCNNYLHFMPKGVLCLLGETGILFSFMPIFKYFTSSANRSGTFLLKQRPIRSNWKTVDPGSTVGRGESLFVSQEAALWTKFCKRR